MASVHITEAAIRAASAEAVASGQRRDITDKVQRGLVVRVTPTGATSFAFSYRLKGEAATQRITLGSFPQVKLAEARDRAEKLARKIRDGIDPKDEERQRKEAAAELAARKTVQEAIDEYLKIKVTKPRSQAGARSTFYKDVVPAVGTKALADFTKKDMQKIIAGVEARGSMTQAGLVLQYTRAMMNWHIERGTIERHDFGTLKVSHKSEPRDRILSVNEIRAFWRLLPEVRMYEPERDILRLQILLGARVGEVAGMMRHEIDLERHVWTIPKERCKNSHAHELPLPPMARDIIMRAMQSQKGKLLFPRHDGKRLTPNAIATSLLRAQPEFAFKKPDGTANNFTSHDLRRTCASLMEQGGTSRTVVSSVLNHRDGTNVTDRHYIHNDVMRDRRVALLKWEANLRAVLAGQNPFLAWQDDPERLEAEILGSAAPAPANVVPLRAFR